VGFVEGRTSRSRIGVSPIVAEALLISVAVAIGIALLLVSQSWASVTNAKSVEQTNKEVAQQWSLLLVEHAFVSADGSATVYVSNPGKYQLVILRCVVYQKGYSPPAVPFSEIDRVHVPADMRQVVPLTCPVYGSGQSYVVEIFAIPNHLYDPREPLTNAQYGVTVRYDLHLQR
jgi:archaellum component FlaF (FlaF/FlaG flagellin family)